MVKHRHNTGNVIHKSRWAVTEKCGDKVYKYFLYDSYPKIKKEVLLLQLSVGRKVNLFYDDLAGCWVCESDFMDLMPVIDNIHFEKFIAKINLIFSEWNMNNRYRNLISDEWSDIVVPWYCMLLKQYTPNCSSLVDWLQNSRGEHFIHGDFTLSNIYLDREDNVKVLDYENATFGPALWDETTLVYSFIEEKQFPTARRIYDYFSCNKEMLQIISNIRLAQSIRKNQNISQRLETQEYVLQNY